MISWKKNFFFTYWKSIALFVYSKYFWFCLNYSKMIISKLREYKQLAEFLSFNTFLYILLIFVTLYLWDVKQKETTTKILIAKYSLEISLLIITAATSIEKRGKLKLWMKRNSKLISKCLLRHNSITTTKSRKHKMCFAFRRRSHMFS